MSNIASDNLHKLIKSMSKPEKRYFKVFSSRHIIGEENNYQVLFDAIDKQEEYDEEKLLKRFKDKGFVRRFSIAKNRLYSAILKSLDSFHSNSSVEAQLHRQIHSAEILYHKSLYDQSLKLLHSARKVAADHEMWTILAEISKWEKKIWEKNQYEDLRSDEELQQKFEEDSRIVHQMQLINELWHLKSKLFFTLYRGGKARNEEEVKHLKQIIDKTAGESKLQQSIEAIYLLNHLYSAYYFGLGDYASSYPYLEKNIALIDKENHLFVEEPGIYLSLITNAIYVGSRLGKWKESQKLLEQLNLWASRNNDEYNEDFQLRLFAIRYSTELTLCTQSGDFKRGLELIPEIIAGLRKHNEHLSSVRKAHLYFHIAVIYFGSENYHEALRWTNKLLNDVEIDKSKDIHCMAQLLNLIVHLELKNDDLLPYALRSTQRFLQTRNKVFKVEEVMLDFINNTQKKRAPKDALLVYRELYDALEPLKKDTFERNAFEYFDFLAWAKSKAFGETFSTAIVA
ncbi:MAG: hypothetical protein RLZZ77_668 [Bacteroidota bacterium]|jgi:hypothetical protein